MMKNEQAIKDKITEYRDLGACDRDGNTIPSERRGAGKGDRDRTKDFDKYRAGYRRAFGHD